jgi:hypothetical protein
MRGCADLRLPQVYPHSSIAQVLSLWSGVGATTIRVALGAGIYFVSMQQATPGCRLALYATHLVARCALYATHVVLLVAYHVSCCTLQLSAALKANDGPDRTRTSAYPVGIPQRHIQSATCRLPCRCQSPAVLLPLTAVHACFRAGVVDAARSASATSGTHRLWYSLVPHHLILPCSSHGVALLSELPVPRTESPGLLIGKTMLAVPRRAFA